MRIPRHADIERTEEGSYGDQIPGHCCAGCRRHLPRPYTRAMDATGSNTPRTVPPRRPPLWLIVLASLGVVLVLVGSLLVLLNPSEATFGWYAYAPLSDEAFPAASFMTPEAVAGWVSAVVGLLLWAFCAGWIVGRWRHTPAAASC